MQVPKLREWRERRGLLQRELADAAGLSVRSIAGYETGQGIRPNTARRVADALGIAVEDLLNTAGELELDEWEKSRPKAQAQLWHDESQLRDDTEEGVLFRAEYDPLDPRELYEEVLAQALEVARGEGDMQLRVDMRDDVIEVRVEIADQPARPTSARARRAGRRRARQ